MIKKGLGLALVLMAMVAVGCGDNKKADVTQPAKPAPTKQATTDTTKNVVIKEVKPDGTIVEKKDGVLIITDSKTGKKTYTNDPDAGPQIKQTTEQIHQFPEGKK